MSKCRSCGAEIKFIQTTAGKWMPCNPDAIHFNECDEPTTLVMEDGEVFKVNPEHKYPQDDSFGYEPHWKSCPEADEWRGRK